jgi:hypothetical protein
MHHAVMVDNQSNPLILHLKYHFCQYKKSKLKINLIKSTSKLTTHVIITIVKHTYLIPLNVFKIPSSIILS